jgi:DNA-damage-inducible protein J
MKSTDTYVRARIDKSIKELAENALHDMGLSVSDAIRLLMIRVAKENKMPFSIKVPNKKTIKAIKEIEEGKAQSFNSIDDLMKDLNAKD